MVENLFTENTDPHAPIRQIRPRKGVIIGAGAVGMACAYAALLQNCFDELILQDVNQEKVEGEVMDLVHGLPFIQPTSVLAGTVTKEGRDADIVIITAGAKQKKGETRLDLVQRNVTIFKSVISDIREYCPNAIVLIVSNPVDIMTYVAIKLSGFPSSRILGTGTVLDTARFRYLLAEKLQLDPRNVHGYIIGEHGDSEVPVWSTVNVAGMRLSDTGWDGNLDTLESKYTDVFDHVRNAAYEIIQRKGYTSYAIGLATTEIVTAILRNQDRIFTVSTLLNDAYGLNDICLGVPTVVNRNGAEKTVNIVLSETEQQQLIESGRVLKEIVSTLNL